MSMNAIQFQHGLSLAKFQARYATEQQCEQALVAARWPQGFKCAHCACKRFFLTRNGSVAASYGSASCAATSRRASWAPSWSTPSCP